MKRVRLSSHHLGFLLITPALILVLCVVLYPLFKNILLSFYEKNLNTGFEARFAGVYNYKRLLVDSRFITSFLNTTFFTIVSVSIEFLLGLGIALLLHSRFPGRGLARALILVPWALPTAVMAMAWMWILNDQFGVFNDLLLRLSIIEKEIAWLGSPSLAMFSLILADIWKTTPFIVILLLAGLQSIPRDLYEAIEIDGAKGWQSFRLITLPLLSPSIALAVLFRTVHAFGIFDLVYVLTGGGPGGATETASIYVYNTLFKYLDFGYASALVVATLLILLVLALIIYIPGMQKQVELS